MDPFPQNLMLETDFNLESMEFFVGFDSVSATPAPPPFPTQPAAPSVDYLSDTETVKERVVSHTPKTGYTSHRLESDASAENFMASSEHHSLIGHRESKICNCFHSVSSWSSGNKNEFGSPPAIWNYCDSCILRKRSLSSTSSASSSTAFEEPWNRHDTIWNSNLNFLQSIPNAWSTQSLFNYSLQPIAMPPLFPSQMIGLPLGNLYPEAISAASLCASAHGFPQTIPLDISSSTNTELHIPSFDGNFKGVRREVHRFPTPTSTPAPEEQLQQGEPRQEVGIPSRKLRNLLADQSSDSLDVFESTASPEFKPLEISMKRVCKSMDGKSRLKKKPKLIKVLARSCLKCDSELSSCWYKDKVNQEKWNCSACYSRWRRDTFDRPTDRLCAICGTDKTSIWYRHNPDHPKQKGVDQTYRCKRCYDQEKKKG
jgi:hypothetical protein